MRECYARILLALDRPDDALVQLDALEKIEPSFETAVGLRLAARNMSNALRYLETGGPPTVFLDALLNAGDDAQLFGFVIRKSGLNPNTAVGEQAFSLLVRASARDRRNSCLMLLQLNADPNAADADYQVTALMMAATKGNERLVNALIARHAELNAQDYAGFTPLMYAAEAGHTRIVKLLLAGGADPSKRSGEGMSAAEYAVKYRRSDVVKLLEGASDDSR
jgi:ankyrin repeat protein